MPGRNRYANRYDEFQQARDPIPLYQAEIVHADSYLLNIANGQSGEIKISCWPSPEGVDGGRRWGKLGASDVAIMPFRTRAAIASPAAKLDVFELELFLRESQPEGFGPASFPKPCYARCHGYRHCIHSAIHLVNLPAPENLAQCLAETSSSDTTADKPWRFRSEEIQSCDGFSRAAKWKWDANGHQPVVLHGGMAFRHLGKPLVVACRVRGKAFVELPNQHLRIRYQFGNEQSGPKWWTLVPQNSTDDLSQSVHQLEAIIQNLNREPGRSSAAPPVAETSPQRLPQGHNFGASTISGPAHVVMGDIHFGHNPSIFRQGAELQQFDPSLATGMLFQSMNQRIE